MEEGRTKNQAAIRELIGGYVKAVRAKDIDGVMSVYAPEIVAFDIVAPLQYVGAEAFRKPWQEVFERYQKSDSLRGSRPQHHCGRRCSIQP